MIRTANDPWAPCSGCCGGEGSGATGSPGDTIPGMRAGEDGLRRRGGHWIEVVGASLGGALAVALVLASPAAPALFWRVLLRSMVYAVVIGALAGSLVPPAVRRLVPERSPARWLLLAAMLVGVAVVGTALASALVGVVGLGAPHETFRERFPADLRIVVLLSLVI